MDVIGSVLNSGRSNVNTPKKFEPLCPNFKSWTSRGVSWMFSVASVCLSVCLFVCLLVCLFVNFVSRTIKCRMMKLRGALCKNLAQVQMSVKGQRSRSLGTKKEKVQHFVPELSSGAQSSCGSFFSGAVLGGVATLVGKSVHAV